MSMTSSSRADRATGAIALLLIAGLVGCATAPSIAPEAPRPARAVAIAPAPTGAEQVRGRQPVTLDSVAVREVPRDEAVRFMGERFAAAARQPLVVEVRTAAPLGDLTRTSSPVIVLNGDVQPETIARPPDRLLAYLPDGAKLRPVNTVEVVWLGDEERTRTRRPLTFRFAGVE